MIYLLWRGCHIWISTRIAYKCVWALCVFVCYKTNLNSKIFRYVKSLKEARERYWIWSDFILWLHNKTVAFTTQYSLGRWSRPYIRLSLTYIIKWAPAPTKSIDCYCTIVNLWKFSQLVASNQHGRIIGKFHRTHKQACLKCHTHTHYTHTPTSSGRGRWNENRSKDERQNKKYFFTSISLEFRAHSMNIVCLIAIATSIFRLVYWICTHTTQVQEHVLYIVQTHRRMERCWTSSSMNFMKHFAHFLFHILIMHLAWWWRTYRTASYIEKYRQTRTTQ